MNLNFPGGSKSLVSVDNAGGTLVLDTNTGGLAGSLAGDVAVNFTGVNFTGTVTLAKEGGGLVRSPLGALQDVLDHPGLVLNFPLHALSHLQLARARRLAGDRLAAIRACDEFLALWRDADPDIPLLRHARTERRLLQR